MPDNKYIEAVMKAALELDYDTWLKVSRAVTRAFAEKEHKARFNLKLSNNERIKYFYTMGPF